jgi:hypothetical protein
VLNSPVVIKFIDSHPIPVLSVPVRVVFPALLPKNELQSLPMITPGTVGVIEEIIDQSVLLILTNVIEVDTASI